LPGTTKAAIQPGDLWVKRGQEKGRIANLSPSKKMAFKTDPGCWPPLRRKKMNLSSESFGNGFRGLGKRVDNSSPFGANCVFLRPIAKRRPGSAGKSQHDSQRDAARLYHRVPPRIEAESRLVCGGSFAGLAAERQPGEYREKRLPKEEFLKPFESCVVK